MPEEDLLRWDSDNEADFQPLPGHQFEQDSFGPRQFTANAMQTSAALPYEQHQQGANGWNGSSGVPVGYPNQSHSVSPAALSNPYQPSTAGSQSQAWGPRNVAGLQELHLAPDQSAALQAFVGRSLMDDHMHMAGTSSQLPPAMDISPLTPRAVPAAAPFSAPGFNPTANGSAVPHSGASPSNALVLYQAPAEQPLPSHSMGGWHQPGMDPVMARFDGPQHQMSFEDNTDFSQPAASTAGLYSQASVQSHQQVDNRRSMQPLSMGSSRPSSAGSQLASQPQQQQPSQPQHLQVGLSRVCRLSKKQEIGPSSGEELCG